MTYSAILFDCDGVLLDSEPLGCEALAQAITAAGHPMTREQATQIFSGNGADASLAWMEQAGLHAQSVFARADELLFEMFDHAIPLIPGIEQIMRDFDLPMAVCSNSNLRRLDRSLVRTSLAARFGPHIYSAEQVARAKPAPDLAIFAAGRLGIRPEQAIFIDDNPHGILCAREAGCLAVGFIGPSEHRANHADVLAAAGADHIVYGMADFHALLRDLSIPLCKKLA
ncbi:HAD-IA family hydrolase [Paracoccus sp. CPCC 101403]|uniref:phosphoglycolate phosphatase n=1 Tax=Paracoccus broussonetiae TaxID=3075834 RepID=A0ABU3EIK2_9RHOB|nr:HAD-IA family hydrolase [Paracoccus sp. CPCC 101403]MDT1063921.1 HAD-IA family hydrolase [Paracoccus sp. CPCC 101403]